MSSLRRRIRKSLPRRYRGLFELLSDPRNWYVAAFVVIAAGIVNYILTGSRVPPLAFVPPAYLEQSIGETVTLVILTGLGLYFVVMTERSRSSADEGTALALAIGAAVLLVVWYVVILALGGLL
ncbi:MAG: hypothetical protein ACP5LG_02450 [Conexivisphaera sp.]